MKLYIGFWVSSISITIVIITLDLTIERFWKADEVDDVKTMARLNIAMLIFSLVQFFAAVCLDMIILVHYWKAGD